MNDDDDRPGWKAMMGWDAREVSARDIVGLLWRGRMALGAYWKPNWPADDPCWPGRGGEFGIIVWGRIYGFWNDPGY